MAKESVRDIFKFNLLKRTIIDANSKYEFPFVNYSNEVPANLISFNNVLTTANLENCWIHFYIDDYQFERLWHSPEKYVSILKRTRGIISPDFSVYSDMPKAQQIFQIYKTRLLCAYFESHHIKIIPSITWSTMKSLEFTLDGIPKNNVISLSTNGVLGRHRQEFIKVYKEVLVRLKPTHVVIIGRNIDEIDGPNVKWVNNYFQELEEYALNEKERR